MLRDEKNLKDPEKNIKDSTSPVPASYQVQDISYTKTDKLITALYMVTDIIEKDEPLRNKLRTLGTEILTDIYLINRDRSMGMVSFIQEKTKSVISLLDIAVTVNIISEMNFNILKREFSLLEESIRGFIQNIKGLNKKIDLVEFLSENTEEKNVIVEKRRPLLEHLHTEHVIRPIGQKTMKLGVQKGSTLLKALDGIKMSDKKDGIVKSIGHNFDELKKKRREDIVNVIKLIGGGATIKDIKDKLHSFPGQAGSLETHSEKTLQRELVSMVIDGVLKKTGEKRWSKYFIK